MRIIIIGMFLKCQQLCVKYSKASTDAVKNVNLSLVAGEIGVLIGPSGCGKTTLLRAVAGLELVSNGQIILGGDCVADKEIHVAPEHRRIGMVFQDYALFPHMTVAKNVAFGLKGIPAAAQALRVQEVLSLVGLAELKHRFPHQLSGGQQQRVALARALAPNPRLLLLDEPFSNLDIDLRERLAHELRQILKAANATALFVTHDQLEAFAIGDKIGVLYEGQLHQWDSAYDLYHRPATRFVAEFIGHGVFLPAFVSPAQGKLGIEAMLQTPIGTITSSDMCPLPSSLEQTECELLLRADDIVHDDSAQFQGQIVRKSFRGSEFLYTLRLKDGHLVMTHVPSHHDHAIGEWIGIRLVLDHLVTFPVTSNLPAAKAAVAAPLPASH